MYVEICIALNANAITSGTGTNIEQPQHTIYVEIPQFISCYVILLQRRPTFYQNVMVTKEM
jgi:hypothetical protein